MKSRATRRFWQAYKSLPRHAQMLAQKSYQLWSQNHQHPALHFKKLKGGENRFSVRIGEHYRAIGHFAATRLSGFGLERTRITIN